MARQKGKSERIPYTRETKHTPEQDSSLACPGANHIVGARRDNEAVNPGRIARCVDCGLPACYDCLSAAGACRSCRRCRYCPATGSRVNLCVGCKQAICKGHRWNLELKGYCEDCAPKRATPPRAKDNRWHLPVRLESECRACGKLGWQCLYARFDKLRCCAECKAERGHLLKLRDWDVAVKQAAIEVSVIIKDGIDASITRKEMATLQQTEKPAAPA